MTLVDGPSRTDSLTGVTAFEHPAGAREGKATHRRRRVALYEQ
ncbi:hypothetical protein [Streptomyces sp. NPDC005009]